MKKNWCLLIGLVLIISGCIFGSLGSDNGQELPVVGSAANLRRLLEAEQKYLGSWLREAGNFTVDATNETAQSTSAPSHSTTNVQVQGIDEADIVKTDGQYLYHIAGNKVLITLAWPAESLGIVSELELDSFTPATLYVDAGYLVVIGNQYQEFAQPGIKRGTADDGVNILPMPIWQSSSTRVLVYDIRDKVNIVMVRDVELDGWNATSRKRDNYVYLVNSRHVGWFDEKHEPQQPWFRSAGEEEKREIGYDEIRYFPGGFPDAYVMLGVLDLGSGQFEVSTYLGSAQNIYMSHENLYVAMTDWVDTTVYKFSVDKTKIEYRAKAEVKGTPLNQFSMDEYNGYFRIATTDRSNWERITNNVFVLDSGMKVVGKINNIAPDEMIFSARFMGEKGYLVTFELMDPLFVIDLSNPRNPKILGELKIPGFSTYLHPLDENHLLGIGRDTEVRSADGREFFVELGIKLAIFDVSDVNNPIEKHVEILGGQGSWSEVLHNHKALFFHQGVLAIPGTLAEVDEGRGFWDYRLLYSGALFYTVDIESGFSEIGRISHAPEVLDVKEEWHYRYNTGINRVVQIDDALYTFSRTYLMAHNANSFEKLSSLGLPLSGDE